MSPEGPRAGGISKARAAGLISAEAVVPALGDIFGSSGGGDQPRGERLVRQAIGRWRDGLVNLTGTNRLLNFRPTKSSTLAIAVPDAAPAAPGPGASDG